MIKADEAKRMTIVNTSAKKYMEDIEKAIIESANKGLWYTEYSHDITPSESSVLIAIVDELKAEGYQTRGKFCIFNEETNEIEKGNIEICWDDDDYARRGYDIKIETENE